MSVNLNLNKTMVTQYQQLISLQNELALLASKPGVDLMKSQNITSEIRDKEIAIHALKEEFQESLFDAAAKAIENS
ncbi:TPA: hypothetical protein NJ362_004462 [Vibrio parahaemolyticus]|uniref:hypothetical protein n=1 Tax=Vibrio neptunius TaxID=170651 RepID=UPI0030D77E2F|nr:hypothetical protein [Vibrio parahaemolyticus]